MFATNYSRAYVYIVYRDQAHGNRERFCVFLMQKKCHAMNDF